MITRIAKCFTLSFLNTEIKDEAEQKVVQYGIELLLSTIWGYCLVLGVGMIFGQIGDSVLFAIIFSGVRLFTGGYHADTYFKCNCGMVFNSIIECILKKVLMEHLKFIGFCGISLMCILITVVNAPVENKHKKICKEKREKYHKYAIVLTTCLCTLSGVFYQSNNRDICCTILATLIIVSSLIYLGVRKNKRRLL